MFSIFWSLAYYSVSFFFLLYVKNLLVDKFLLIRRTIVCSSNHHVIKARPNGDIFNEESVFLEEVGRKKALVYIRYIQAQRNRHYTPRSRFEGYFKFSIVDRLITRGAGIFFVAVCMTLAHYRHLLMSRPNTCTLGLLRFRDDVFS